MLESKFLTSQAAASNKHKEDARSLNIMELASSRFGDRLGASRINSPESGRLLLAARYTQAKVHLIRRFAETIITQDQRVILSGNHKDRRRNQ